MRAVILVLIFWLLPGGVVKAFSSGGGEMQCADRVAALVDEIGRISDPIARGTLSDEVFSAVSEAGCGKKMDSDADKLVRSLITLLQSRDDRLVYNGARSLSLLGTSGFAAVPELEAARDFYLSRVRVDEFTGPGTPLSAIENAIFRLRR